MGERIEAIIDALRSAPEDAFGDVPDTPDQQGWWIRDELIDSACKVREEVERLEQECQNKPNISENALRWILQQRCAVIGLREWCRQHNVNAGTVSNIINGNRKMQKHIASALGFVPVVRYRPRHIEKSIVLEEK